MPPRDVIVVQPRPKDCPKVRNDSDGCKESHSRREYSVEKSPSGHPSTVQTRDPFVPGAFVIATLCNPREKFWGMILSLAPEGLSLSGAELASFEDLTLMVKEGEPFSPAVVFFPVHRIERVELDLPDGNLPSLSQRFLAKTGLQPSAALTPSDAAQELTGSEISRASKERA